LHTLENGGFQLFWEACIEHSSFRFLTFKRLEKGKVASATGLALEYFEAIKGHSGNKGASRDVKGDVYDGQTYMATHE
jgi:hypothetical protein